MVSNPLTQTVVMLSAGLALRYALVMLAQAVVLSCLVLQDTLYALKRNIFYKKFSFNQILVR